MNSSQQLKIYKLEHLAFLLQISLNDLKDISSNISKYYYQIEKTKLDKNGKQKVRIITPSTEKLKQIQKKIHQKILIKIPLPQNITGAVKGSDNIKNAKYHQGNKYKFATDLKSFFPSVSHHHVIKTLLKHGCSKQVASLITKLTTYKGELPQGAPTSSTLANLVFLPTDFKLINFCKEHDIKYTRYVDDLSFSAKKDFKEKSLEILNIIKEDQFKISHKKTFYTSGVAEFTGIQVKNNTINVPQRIREKSKQKTLNENQKEGINHYINRVANTNKNGKKKVNISHFLKK